MLWFNIIIMNTISLIDELYMCNKFYILCKWMIIDWFFLLHCTNVCVKKTGNRCSTMMVKIDILTMRNLNLIFLVNLCSKKKFFSFRHHEGWILWGLNFQNCLYICKKLKHVCISKVSQKTPLRRLDIIVKQSI